MKYRCAAGKDEQPEELDSDPTSSGVDLTVAAGTRATVAAKQAARTIPIVFVAGSMAGERICALAARRRLPSVGALRPFADAGCLMTYVDDLADTFLRAAGYVDRIFKGAKPADLPVQNPIKLELVVDLKTAKALGVTIPQTVLVRTDEVIQ
jgi:putative ABC transport system substrate-binding protein